MVEERTDPDLEARIDALFAGPPSGFVAARDGLADELRRSGRPAAASGVRALRRPTMAAWALNRLAHDRSDDLDRLLALGDELRSAQEAMLAGSPPAEVKRVAAAARTLVASLTAGALALLGGPGAAQRDEISHTLEAALADPEHGAAVAAGRLVRALAAPSGLGGPGTHRPGGPTSAEPRVPPVQVSEPGSPRLDRLRAEAERRTALSREADRESVSADEEVRARARLLAAAQQRAEAAADRALTARAEAQRARRALAEAEEERGAGRDGGQA